jgi:chitin synthase
LTSSLGSKELLDLPGRILSIVFEWGYLATLMTCFVLALGNRPQGSNKLYMTMVYFWVIIMGYLMFASVFITVKSVQAETKNGFKLNDLFQNTIFSTLIVSMLSTYVLYFIVSFLFFDPWHMFTSFIQYLLLTPTYINILNVYAFCNTHDITWGTKGDTKAEKLGAASVTADGKIKVDVPTEDADLNTQYEKELMAFGTKYIVPKKTPSPEDKQEDYYKGFRSVVVLAWMFMNLTLCAVVLQTGGLQVTVDPAKQQDEQNQKARIYLSVVLWSVAGLSLFRFIGAMWFLIVRMVSFLPPLSRVSLLTFPSLVPRRIEFDFDHDCGTGVADLLFSSLLTMFEYSTLSTTSRPRSAFCGVSHLELENASVAMRGFLETPFFF